jgi:hypothetical protein
MFNILSFSCTPFFVVFLSIICSSSCPPFWCRIFCCSSVQYSPFPRQNSSSFPSFLSTVLFLIFSFSLFYSPFVQFSMFPYPCSSAIIYSWDRKQLGILVQATTFPYSAFNYIRCIKMSSSSIVQAWVKVDVWLSQEITKGNCWYICRGSSMTERCLWSRAWWRGWWPPAWRRQANGLHRPGDQLQLQQCTPTGRKVLEDNPDKCRHSE